MSDVHLEALLDKLDAGACVVLPTARAASALRAAHDERQRVRADAAWATAPIYAWTQWTQAQWGELIVSGAEQRMLLNPAQELAIWREIVMEAPAGSEAALGPPDALAQMAHEAWVLAASFRATAQLRASANTHDSRVFAAWADAFMRRCDARGYLSASLLEEALQHHLETGALEPPRDLMLVGFAEETSTQQSLLAAFARLGTSVHRCKLLHTEADESALRAWVVAASEQEELTLAARWIRGLLEDRTAAGLDARVAVLVPQLAEERGALEAALRDALAPELHAIDADISSTPWEFSAGPPLASLPIVAAAMGLARCAAHVLSLDAVTALVLSPYIGQNAIPAEREASACFDAQVLRHNPSLRDELTLAQVLALAGRADQPPSVLRYLRDAQSVVQRAGELQRPRSCADWGEFVRDLTRAANWPGERVLNATEFEATRAWDALLDTLATLDFQGKRLPYATFLQELDRQANAAAFMPPATHAPVQVMGIHEAEGCLFDAVVLLRATDANWPRSERAHPLIAWPLQRSLQMPGTDPARASARAQAAAMDLLDRCGSLLCTMATEDGDGPLRPSPLISAMELRAMEAADLVDHAEPAATIHLEATVDDAPLPALVSSEVPGGAKVLKLQAACGFLAFAEIRLRASEPDTPTMGLDAGEAGSFLHKALQEFWQETRTQEALRRLSREERRQQLAACIDRALPRRLRAESTWDNAYLSLQKERLLTVLDDWLDWELARAPFEIVDLERDEEVSIGPLSLKVRMDRIDRVGDVEAGSAGFVLVDYKSGNAGHPREWESIRPVDPQLPLYALQHEAAELKGLAFAKVRTGREMRWLGVQTDAGLLPNERTNKLVEMEARLDAWRATLTQLAEDFAAGRADVLPRDFHKDCVRCAQRLLCRVDKASLQATMDEEATEDVDG